MYIYNIYMYIYICMLQGLGLELKTLTRGSGLQRSMSPGESTSPVDISGVRSCHYDPATQRLTLLPRYIDIYIYIFMLVICIYIYISRQVFAMLAHTSETCLIGRQVLLDKLFPTN